MVIESASASAWAVALALAAGAAPPEHAPEDASPEDTRPEAPGAGAPIDAPGAASTEVPGAGPAEVPGDEPSASPPGVGAQPPAPAMPHGPAAAAPDEADAGTTSSPSTAPAARTAPVDRVARGEVLLDAAAAPRPPDAAALPVHGEARVGLGFGAVMQDVVAVVHPSLELDFTELAPVWLRVGAPVRLRMIERAPDQSGVVRRRDWDEAGDGLAVLERIDYADEFALARPGHAAISVHGGRLRGVDLGHRSVLRGYDNSLDLDGRRTGVEARTEVVSELLGQPARADAAIVIADLAGSQIIGGRIGGRWAGAGIGLSAVGDPTAPRALARPAGAADRFARGRAGRLQSEGARGVAALALELSYEATDSWRYRVEPYLDLVAMPGLSRGLHLGADFEVVLGRGRRVRLGGVAELTVGDSSYAPAYFDVFYVAERWQAPLYATPADRPDDLVDVAAPKYAFARDANLFGAGGYGGLRFSHDSGAFAQAGYQARPGPRGHTFSLQVGVDLRSVTLAALLAHRGRHGFQPQREGSLAAVDLRVPILRWVDVFTGFGWTFAVRADPTPPPGGEDTGLVTGAGFFVAGVGGRVPW